MENLGEISINGKIVKASAQVNVGDVKDLENLLTTVQNQKRTLKDDLDTILEEIYN